MFDQWGEAAARKRYEFESSSQTHNENLRLILTSSLSIPGVSISALWSFVAGGPTMTGLRVHSSEAYDA